MKRNKLIRLLFEAPAEPTEEKDPLAEAEKLSNASLDTKVDAILSKAQSTYDGSDVQEDDLPSVIATNINNLVVNFENLVDPSAVLLNRALNWVSANKPELREAVEEVLLTEFDLQTKLESSSEDELNGSIPAAAGAGGDASGGGSV